MNQPIDFLKASAAFFAELGEHQKIVLATSAQNHTTARMMSCIIREGKIAMQTDTAFEKYKQMLENPQVALCSDDTQIEGIAAFLGHPLEEKNAEFAALLKKYFPATYENYSSLASEIVVEITPTKATQWRYEAGAAYLTRIDFVKQIAYHEEYIKNI